MLFEIGFLANFKVFIVAILMYVIIYSLLKKVNVFGDEKEVSSLIALISVIIVSFTGVLTYVVTYAITWFAVMIFIFFLIFILMSFVGIKLSDVHSIFSKNSKLILIVFLVIFSIIILKGFFALNNTFDISNPQNDSYAVNTSFNSGINDVVPQKEKGFFDNINLDINSDLVSSALFLAGVGLFILLIG